MALSEEIIRAIAVGGAIALTPLAMRALSRLAPPRAAAADVEVLRKKYGKLEVASQLAALAGMFGALAVCLAARKNSPWMLGVMFGWMVAAPMALVAAVTLSKGRADWDAFWCYYEKKYHVGLRFVFPLYGFLIALGLLSSIAFFT